MFSFLNGLFPKAHAPLPFRHVFFAHRGGTRYHPENTIPAFRHAVENGAHVLEMDVRLTLDGEVIVSHDDDLSRQCPQLRTPMCVATTNYCDLPLVHGREQFPKLEEVLQAFPDVAMNIDLKVESLELLEKTCRLIETYKREHITIWGSRFYGICNKCYERNPSIPLFFSLRKVLMVYIWYYLGLLYFIPLKERFLEIPFVEAYYVIQSPFWRKVFEYLYYNQKLFDYLEKERGVHVVWWVLNSEPHIEKAFRQYHAAGVMTDDVVLLNDWIRNNL